MKRVDAMWLTPAARRDVATALIDRLPGWPDPDMLTECARALVIAWDLGAEIAGAIVGEQMISVFWGKYQEATETSAAAAEMRSGRVAEGATPPENQMMLLKMRSGRVAEGATPPENQMMLLTAPRPPYQSVSSSWSRWDEKTCLAHASKWED